MRTYTVSLNANVFDMPNTYVIVSFVRNRPTPDISV